MTEAEIKPCPFCGKTDTTYVEGATFRWMAVQCNYCGAQSGEVRVSLANTTVEKAAEAAQRRALIEWNTRA